MRASEWVSVCRRGRLETAYRWWLAGWLAGERRFFFERMYRCTCVFLIRTLFFISHLSIKWNRKKRSQRAWPMKRRSRPERIFSREWCFERVFSFFIHIGVISKNFYFSCFVSRGNKSWITGILFGTSLGPEPPPTPPSPTRSSSVINHSDKEIFCVDTAAR